MNVVQRIPRRALRAALVLAGLAAGALALRHLRSSLPPAGQIGRPEGWWLVLALLAEAASLAAYALVVRELLAVWSIRGRLRMLLRATLGGIALSASLPGGQALSTAYWYRQLRAEGADNTRAALVLAGAMLAGAVSLATILVAGIAAAGSDGPLAAARIPVLSAAGAVVVLRLVFRRRFGRVVRSLVRRLAPALADDVAAGRTKLASVAALACLNWLLDCAALVASLAAMHAGVPARSVVLTYALAQVVASLPLLPGGGGTVELSLTLGFAAFGHTSGNVLAGVILFRLISCWGLVPPGWLGVAADGRRLRLARATVEPVRAR